MAKIPPAAWLLVGAAVTIVSIIKDELRIFVIPGVAFVLWGLAKPLMASRKASAPDHTYNTKPHGPDEPTRKRCYVCSARNNAKANYCGHCGHKLP